MNTAPIIINVPEYAQGKRLSVFLRESGVSLSVVRSLKYQADGILLNGVRVHTSALIDGGDVVELRPCLEETTSVKPEDITLDIVYQSQHALVLNKPAGMATHPDPSHHTGTLANAVCGYYSSRGLPEVFRPVGRLDANTSGLSLCAQNAVSPHLLSRTAQKIYLALVEGVPADDQGIIDAPLGPKPGSRLLQWVSPEGRPSVTHYHVIAFGDAAALVAVFPKTGRTHQIRAHFAYKGHPLMGDALYGGSTKFLKRHALHCAGLRFTELSGNRPTLWCPLPIDMTAAARHEGLNIPAVAFSQVFDLLRVE